MARTEKKSARWRGTRPDHQLPPGRGEAGSGPAVGPGRRVGAEGPEPGLGALLRSLGEDVGTLVRQEPKARRRGLPGLSVAITGGRNPVPASGHTCTPLTATL